ncbi:GspH/FimT family pseudopilin [uncultured Thiohalocapsa sp.]|uniref:GspH/FimT family pseudopilin n=1 Tax=uncultured Thiohalocapsa sp. TaxID=768990 RepID=UPI0025E54013|nr:GspH/FimT family pseudopilin [uncultured Thiohalocapsa sp.]
MSSPAGRQSQRGVTLVELLVTLSIAVIVLTVGVSGMTTLVKRNTRAAEVNALLGHLNFARAQAIMRAADVIVCPVNTANPSAGCTLSKAAWANGYAVIDADSGAVLRIEQGSDTVTMTSTARGFRFQDDGTATNGHITVCDADDDAKTNAARADDVLTPVEIIISPVGRVRVSDKDGSGNDPDCS